MLEDEEFAYLGVVDICVAPTPAPPPLLEVVVTVVVTVLVTVTGKTSVFVTVIVVGSTPAPGCAIVEVTKVVCVV